MSTRKSLQETLITLREEYAKQLPQTITDILTLGQQLQKQWTLENLRQFQQKIHRIAGNAGSFGFLTLSQTARVLDTLLVEILERNTPVEQHELTEIVRRLEHIQQASLVADEPTKTISTPPPTVQMPTVEKIIYLVDDDIQLANLLAEHLKSYGYNVKAFNNTHGLSGLIQVHPPALIIMDVMLAEGELAGPQIMYAIQKNRREPLPVIFISARTDMTARLAAVRANGDAYFNKPLDIPVLVSKIKQLTENPKPKTPRRILIIDDTNRYGENYAKILQQSGLQTAVLKEPLRIIDALDKFPPALILINTQLQTLNAIELAVVIRQQEKYKRLPLIFFAQQFDQTLRRAAVKGIADDFLNETIEADALVATIINRLKHNEHQLQNTDYLHSDITTGLYNRQYLLSQLELIKMASSAYPLVALYINIDSYRGISKILGYNAIDKAMYETAQFLQQQVNKSDLLARFSDNVFVIISIDRAVHEAKALANSIRATLESYVLEINGQQVVTTCSIGIGVYNDDIANGASTAISQAESACQQAQEAGGNRIQLHNAAENIKRDQYRQTYWQETIKSALVNNGFYLVYQPIVSLHGRADKLYDVLLRLHSDDHPDGIKAHEFLPIAEQHGLIEEIDRWVIKQAVLSLMQRYHEREEISFFIRLSGTSLSNPNLPAYIRKCLSVSGVPYHAVIFNISQNVAVSHLKETQIFIKNIKSLGCRIALQDFNGKSSAFQLLKLLEANFIKLNIDLVKTLTNKADTLSNIKQIADKAHTQTSAVIVPFIEDATTLSLLWECAIDYIEGNFIQIPIDTLSYDFSG
ncbi:EAL domain-containing protein [Beggiatoa leptomitoformis]|uniref:EAL domain-containing protein n=1 Tax=Beggiatoa leptomitoformis TaxID=288004 RepID=UPI0007057E45|nr:EAL domain-containing protein [Beggiatoa leptomitoformis]